jgi:hypothetical protein
MLKNLVEPILKGFVWAALLAWLMFILKQVGLKTTFLFAFIPVFCAYHLGKDTIHL